MPQKQFKYPLEDLKAARTAPLLTTALAWPEMSPSSKGFFCFVFF